MAKSLQAWKDQVYNHTVDLDNKSFDCVDVPKSWVQYLTDVSWTQSAGWGNAKDIYYQWSKQYLDRVPRGNAPRLGDIVCMDGTMGGGYGHTGVVVGISGSNITIYQQDTFKQAPVFTGVYNAYSSYIIGFMRPNANAPFTLGYTPTLLGNQRVAAYAAKYRDEPNSNATVLKTFVADSIYDFKGFVHGESVNNNDVWFVGLYTGGYAWSGAFTDTDTHDLPDLTQRTKLLGNQREVGNSIINYRKTPEVQPDNVIKTYNPTDVLDFDAYAEGALVNGSNIWFRGKYTHGWAHSGGFTDTGTHDLQKITLEVIPVPVTPAPTPLPIDASRFVVDLSNFNKVTDFPKLKSSVRGVIWRAGHVGVSYGGVQPYNADPTFSTAKALLGEKLIGAYWYGYASLDPEEEAAAFVASVGQVPTNFSYWLDIEEPSGKSNVEINAWAKAFCATVDTLTNRVCGLYMNTNWYNTIIDAESKGTRPIWLANYSVAENTAMVPNQVAHQFTSKGAVSGVEGNVDINAVTEQFFTPTAIVPSVPVEPPVQPTPVPQPIPEPTPEPPRTDPVTQLFDFIANLINQIFKKKK